MMFKAEIEINTVDEFNAFALFMSNIAAMRGVLRPEQPKQEVTPAKREPTVTQKEAEEDEIAATIQPETDPVVGHITPEGSTITDAAMIEAFQTYVRAKKPSIPALTELLAKYEVKKVGEIAQERRAEFLAEVRV